MNALLQLREIALTNIGAIEKRADLSKKLSVLLPDEIKDLVCNKVILHLLFILSVSVLQNVVFVLKPSSMLCS